MDPVMLSYVARPEYEYDKMPLIIRSIVVIIHIEGHM